MDNISRTRVLTAIDGARPDRVPTFDSFWTEFREAAVRELGLPGDVDLDDHFDIDICIAVADETPFPSAARTLRVDGDTRVQVDGWGRTVETRTGAFFYRELGVPINSRADVEGAVFEAPALDDRYAGFLRTVARNRDRRCVFVKTGGPFLRSAFMRGKAAFLEDIAGDPPFAKALADKVADHIIGIGLESLRRGDLWDNGLWIYDDMAYNDGPLFSPGSFETVFLPAYRRLVAAFKEAGCRRVIVHSDGDIRSLLDMLLDAGVDGINPVEPRAGMHLPTLKKQYGERLAWIGGMCNSQVLPLGPAAAIRRQTREILEAGADGGVAIGAHSIGPDIPVAHYVAYHEMVRAQAAR